ncbi:dockerin type I domain-containing protein [Lacipirellula sp.]|uniref:dockerin type I domain-containing protein n=1 Tax=Lacipirellula sp. TaxID=2691419 RepID=UPI003D0BCF72
MNYQRTKKAAALAAACAILSGPQAWGANLIWNKTTGNFQDANAWSYTNSGAEAQTTDPFAFPGQGGIPGANVLYVVNNGDTTLNTTSAINGAGNENLVYSVQVGSNAGAANVAGPNDHRGAGTLRVTGNTPLLVYYAAPPASEPYGQFVVGANAPTAGTVVWDSTNALTVHGAMRVGQGGTGTFTQNNGTVHTGINTAASGVFFAVGNGSSGTYNLNNGILNVGAALDSPTSQEVRRNSRIGAGASGVGVMNIGDGTGAAASAKYATWDDFTVGHSGATGTINIKSDGRLEVNYAALNGAAGGGAGATAPFLVNTGQINQQGGSFDADGIVQLGMVGASSYNVTGSTGSINMRALEVGATGTLKFTFDAGGVTPFVVEGDTNTAGDTAKGLTLAATSALSLNSFNAYNSNSTLTLVNSLDSTVLAVGTFGNYTQGQSVGTNALGTQFYLNYYGGVDNNDIVLQTTTPGSLTSGLVWNTTSANFTAGFASGNGNYGVGTFPANPFSGGQELYLGNNGVAALSGATSESVALLHVGTDQASARIANRDGNGTVNATGSVSLKSSATGGAGDVIVGSGGQSGTINWGSTGTLEAEAKLWVGDGGTGVVTQTAGIVSGGTTVAGTFLAVGHGAGGSGTYNLNNGQFRPTGTLDNALGRVTAIGDLGATGTLNVGDGTGAAGSALLEANNDLLIGRDGGTGTLNVKSDGRIRLDSVTGGVGGNAELNVGNGSTGTVVQTGGSVSTTDLIRIGVGAGSVGSYTISGGTLDGATDGTGAFQIGRQGATGTLRIEGTGKVTHGAEFFVGNETNTGGTGRLELIGSQAGLQIGKLENAPGGVAGVNEIIRWVADANGVTPMVVTGAGPTAASVQLQDPTEVTANTGSGATLSGDGIALELNLSAFTSSGILKLIDNQTAEAVTGFFENGSSLDLFEEGALITGTGYAGTVNISYIGGDGNDVVLNLVGSIVNNADFNGDGKVDGADFLSWQRGFGVNSGATLAQGDANGDGAVNAADLTIWKGQFGVPAQIAAAAVPEPHSIALASAAFGLIAVARRRGVRR